MLKLALSKWLGKQMNSVSKLRAEQLALSTRQFVTRGSNIARCDECMLSKSNCLCHLPIQTSNQCAIALIMAHGEYYKPSNTGQLIAKVISDNYAFRWSRTEVEPMLIELINDKQFQPVVIFVHDNIGPDRQIHTPPELDEGKRYLFIFIDGTWRQAKKMMNKSPYLDSLPVLQLPKEQLQRYILRTSAHEHHLSTAEVAINLFELCQFEQAKTELSHLYDEFKRRYLLSKSNHKQRDDD